MPAFPTLLILALSLGAPPTGTSARNALLTTALDIADHHAQKLKLKAEDVTYSVLRAYESSAPKLGRNIVLEKRIRVRLEALPKAERSETLLTLALANAHPSGLDAVYSWYNRHRAWMTGLLDAVERWLPASSIKHILVRKLAAWNARLGRDAAAVRVYELTHKSAVEIPQLVGPRVEHHLANNDVKAALKLIQRSKHAGYAEHGQIAWYWGRKAKWKNARIALKKANPEATFLRRALAIRAASVGNLDLALWFTDKSGLLADWVPGTWGRVIVATLERPRPPIARLARLVDKLADHPKCDHMLLEVVHAARKVNQKGLAAKALGAIERCGKADRRAQLLIATGSAAAVDGNRAEARDLAERAARHVRLPAKPDFQRIERALQMASLWAALGDNARALKTLTPTLPQVEAVESAYLRAALRGQLIPLQQLLGQTADASAQVAKYVADKKGPNRRPNMSDTRHCLPRNACGPMAAFLARSGLTDDLVNLAGALSRAKALAEARRVVALVPQKHRQRAHFLVARSYGGLLSRSFQLLTQGPLSSPEAIAGVIDTVAALSTSQEKPIDTSTTSALAHLRKAMGLRP